MFITRVDGTKCNTYSMNYKKFNILHTVLCDDVLVGNYMREKLRSLDMFIFTEALDRYYMNLIEEVTAELLPEITNNNSANIAFELIDVLFYIDSIINILCDQIKIKKQGDIAVKLSLPVIDFLKTESLQFSTNSQDDIKSIICNIVNCIAQARRQLPERKWYKNYDQSTDDIAIENFIKSINLMKLSLSAFFDLLNKLIEADFISLNQFDEAIMEKLYVKTKANYEK